MRSVQLLPSATSSLVVSRDYKLTSNAMFVQKRNETTTDMFTVIVGSENFKLKYITKAIWNGENRGIRMKVEIIQFLNWMIFSVIEILFEASKALGPLGHRNHEGHLEGSSIK